MEKRKNFWDKNAGRYDRFTSAKALSARPVELDEAGA